MRTSLFSSSSWSSSSRPRTYTFLVVVLVLGCAPPAAPPTPALNVTPVAVRVPAGESGPLPPERCPPDALWNGRVCLGGGYVACPGDARFDDAGSCQRAPAGPLDAGRERRDD